MGADLEFCEALPELKSGSLSLLSEPSLDVAVVTVVAPLDDDDVEYEDDEDPDSRGS